MPISVVVGGQFGSEGKGKVAYSIAKKHKAKAVVRVGGPNSGHTVVDNSGNRVIFQQLPTAAIHPDIVSVISAGSYIDLVVLKSEIKRTSLGPNRLKIDPKAVIISESCVELENQQGLRLRVGSTLTGTGAAVSQRADRNPLVRFARDEPELREYLTDTSEYLYKSLCCGDRIVAEGSQGFGLSVIHTPHYPFATSRDTTAAGVLSEIGLSPLMVDEVALVLRAFPIRVPGNSGPLARETSWRQISEEGGFSNELEELTSVTRARRRVGYFDEYIVDLAIKANMPSLIFLNHVDYVDSECLSSGYPRITPKVEKYVSGIEARIGRCIDYIGLSPSVCISFGTI